MSTFEDATVAIIVPVYRGEAETRRCLESVFTATCKTPSEVVVIDDCSPDPSLACYLESLAATGHITLLRNAENRGFVASVNIGMAQRPDCDVVLLNSDTEVANDWLDRLRNAAGTGIGTVTPFSNNATICSFPIFCADNPMPPDQSVAELDRVFANVNAGKTVDIPTGVGFCMYIRRACLDAVGVFDEKHFGRGYGEENDFCCRAVKAGWRNALATDTFVFHAGNVSFRDERAACLINAEAALKNLHPEYFNEVRSFVRRDPVAPFRLAVEIALAAAVPPAPTFQTPSTAKVQLHIVHDLGGGVARWVNDFCNADKTRRNLILKPYCSGPSYGQGLMLFGGTDEEEPLWSREYINPIAVTLPTHEEYHQALVEIVREFQVDTIIVSSLIGHALDILDTGLPTAIVAHDFFPICPAINLHFGDVCMRCDDDRLVQCHRSNPDFNAPFLKYLPDDRIAVRRRYIECVNRGDISLVVPTPGVRSHLLAVAPALSKARFVTVPHGVQLAPLRTEPPQPEGRLRIMMLGMLSISKGLRLLEQCIDRLTVFADIYLVGAQEVGELFSGRPAVQVIERYDMASLPAIASSIRPHLGLLLSIWPETFSYTLSELMLMGIPPMATRLGSFADRILDGETGYLVSTNPDDVVSRLMWLDRNRNDLERVCANLKELPRRLPSAMVGDYHALLPFGRATGAGQVIASSVSKGDGSALVRQSKLWKRLKREQLVAEIRELKLLRIQESIEQTHRENSDLRVRLEESEAKSIALSRSVGEILDSTSWRISAPVRWLGRALGRRHLTTSMPFPAHLEEKNSGVRDARETTDADWRQDAYREFCSSRDRFLPDIMGKIAAMEQRPLISVLVPTYNTQETMLREMLDSVLSQWYPEWELVIVDDGSDQSHVVSVLQEYALHDPRIQLQFSEVNQGVARASNLALQQARGHFLVLLDHDDLLEPQALFRVAESVVADDPDILYSDELIVGEDGKMAHWFVFRPAFSPEYLRAHPYIVHLAGFKRQLLLELGGFDADLPISQDYDLILRASEHARRIIHIPEILYRWRTHSTSAGHRYIDQVMEISSRVLQKHLDRCRVQGTVGDGAGFNFFDTRYVMDKSERVAIIIPTRNHGELLRQCIESIRRTVSDVNYDIVVIDHLSDDAATIGYLDSLRKDNLVLRYEREFNFSAMNNWAVGQLPAGYSYILFCNNDVEALKPGWLERMLELASQPDVGIVGAKLFYPDKVTVQHVGVYIGGFGAAENLGRFMKLDPNTYNPGYLGALIANREVAAVTAACLLMKESVFVTLGGFDEALKVLFGDVDLCLRAASRGQRSVICPAAELLHHESISRGRGNERAHKGDIDLFLARWGGLLAEGDPYFNPNLELHSSFWDVARPMRFKPDIRRRIYERTNDGPATLGSSSIAGASLFEAR